MKVPSLGLVFSLLLVVGGGWLIGSANLPDDWYQGLAKPSFSPPIWLYPPVWTLLNILIAIAGWRTFEKRPQSTAMALWGVQLLLSFFWTPVMFTSHELGVALVMNIALLICAIAFITVQCRPDRTAALLLVPYAAWGAFAAVLHASIWTLNS